MQEVYLRARAGLGLVDAIHIASAKEAGVTAFVTNDARLNKPGLGLAVVFIEDVAL
jgi:predicted nucleic acid-binding protein